MSLKAFHIFFIIVSMLLCVFLAVWEAKLYLITASTASLVLVGAAVAALLLLGAYLRHVFIKYKNVGLI